MDTEAIKKSVERMRALTKNEVYCNALLYHQLGFTVVPSIPGEKHPSVKWKLYQTQRSTEKDLQDWFLKGKKPAYGFITGKFAKRVVVEADSAEAVQWLEKNTVSTPMKVKRLNGIKEHWYFNYPDLPEGTRIKTYSKVLTIGGKVLDLDIRGDGGFIMGAGVVTPERNYRPVTPFEEIDPASIPVFNPDWIPGCLGSVYVASANSEHSEITTSPETYEKAKEYLKTAPVSVDGRGGHDALFQTLCDIIQGHNIRDERDVLNLLQEDWNLRCSPPWYESDLSYQIKSVLERECEHPGYLLYSDDSKWSNENGPFEDPGLKAAMGDSVYEDFLNNSDNWSKGDWEEMTLPKRAMQVPLLPECLLPVGISQYILDEAAALNVNVEFLLVSYLIILGSLIGRKVVVYPKLKNKWYEVPNLWGMCIAPPSQKKSPALESSLNMLRPFIRQATDKYEREKKAYKEKKREIDLLCKEKNLAPAQIEYIKEFEEKGPPKKKVLEVNDATIPRLHQILSDNPNGVFLCLDELVTWFKSMDQKGHETDRGYFLKTWMGRQEQTVDRKGANPGEETSVTARCCVSIFGSVTPAVIQDYVKSTTESHGGDGLIQRCQLIVYPSQHPAYAWIDTDENSTEKFRVHSIFEFLNRPDLAKLIGLSQKVDIEKEVTPLPPGLRFSLAAYELMMKWAEQLHKQTALFQAKTEAFGSHVAKYSKMVTTLALIYHMIDLAEGREVGLEITEHSFRCAAALTEFFHLNALKLYGYSLETTLHKAFFLIERMKEGEIKSGDTMRSIYKHGWGGLDTKEKTEAPLAYLESLHVIRIKDVAATVRGGRPSQIIEINPKLDSIKEVIDNTPEMFESPWLEGYDMGAHHKKYPAKPRELPPLYDDGIEEKTEVKWEEYEGI